MYGLSENGTSTQVDNLSEAGNRESNQIGNQQWNWCDESFS